MKPPMTKAIEAIQEITIDENIKTALIQYMSALMDTEQMEIQLAFDKGYQNGATNQDRINAGITQLKTSDGIIYYKETFNS